MQVGAEVTEEYFPLLEGRRIGVFTNHTGMVGSEHLVDLLLRKGYHVAAIFSPEHGFRGDADAGEAVADATDAKTGIPVYSLYKGSEGSPGLRAMSGVDLLIIDIQDVGLRFYTYYISMYRLMAACAGRDIEALVLDRPNPNGFYTDGPVLDMKYKSGVGWLPIPVVHGMTLGELAMMINGEKWLPDGKVCRLRVIRCRNYSRDMKYSLPVPPSPNLPNMKAVYLYPSLCLFEGTTVSLGRGTAHPFQLYGSPSMKGCEFSFTPRSVRGAKAPPFLNEECYGVDLRDIPDETIWRDGFTLRYIIDAYNKLGMGEKFFTPFFENLIGVDYVRRMIMDGMKAEEIKSVWRGDVERFTVRRRAYLLY